MSRNFRSSAPRRQFLTSIGSMMASPWLVSCGGGSGEANAAPAPSTPTSPSPPPAPSPNVPLARWVPAPGQIANIGLNDLSSLNPCKAGSCWYGGSSRQEAPWRNWCGAAFAREYSTHGAMIFWGGGHGGGDDHGLYVFDFTSRLWSRVGPSIPAQSYLRELDKEWSDYLHEGSYIVPGLHTYNYPTYVPPGKPGVGPRGAWLLPALVSGPGGNAPHAVDLATGQWFRFTTTKEGSYASPYSGTLEDTKRGRIWWGGTRTRGYLGLDFNDEAPRKIQKVNGTWFGGWYDRFVYVPEADMALCFWCEFGRTEFKAQVIDLRSGQPVSVPFQPIPPRTMASAGFGADWCPVTKKFYLYEGRGQNTLAVLTPSSLDFSNCSWSWNEESFGGATAAWFGTTTGGGGAIPLTRWRYVPALNSFAWSDGPRVAAASEDGVTRDGVMQLWRPRGT